MPIIEPRYGIEKPLTSDPFSTATIADNYDRIAAKPGTHICTAATRPTDWDANHLGMTIYETDSGLSWRWNGSAFVRDGAIGALGYGIRTLPLTAGTTDEVAVSLDVTIPPGGRSVIVTGSWAETSNPMWVSLYKAAQEVQRMSCATDGGTLSFYDNAPDAGPLTYSLRVRAKSGSADLISTASRPVLLHAVEV